MRLCIAVVLALACSAVFCLAATPDSDCVRLFRERRGYLGVSSKYKRLCKGFTTNYSIEALDLFLKPRVSKESIDLKKVATISKLNTSAQLTCVKAMRDQVVTHFKLYAERANLYTENFLLDVNSLPKVSSPYFDPYTESYYVNFRQYYDSVLNTGWLMISVCASNNRVARYATLLLENSRASSEFDTLVPLIQSLPEIEVYEPSRLCLLSLLDQEGAEINLKTLSKCLETYERDGLSHQALTSGKRQSLEESDSSPSSSRNLTERTAVYQQNQANLLQKNLAVLSNAVLPVVPAEYLQTEVQNRSESVSSSTDKMQESSTSSSAASVDSSAESAGTEASQQNEIEESSGQTSAYDGDRGEDYWATTRDPVPGIPDNLSTSRSTAREKEDAHNEVNSETRSDRLNRILDEALEVEYQPFTNRNYTFSKL